MPWNKFCYAKIKKNLKNTEVMKENKSSQKKLKNKKTTRNVS